MATAMETQQETRADSPATNALKRRQEEDESLQDGKRQRVETGKNTPGADEEPASAAQAQSPADVHMEGAKVASQEGDRPSRSRPGTVDEKQRNKRLFGALLGSLNRPSDRASKRRAEIEQRRKAELQQQDDERLEDRQRRLERLAKSRRRIQIDVDEDNMLARHRNIIKAANFLQTRTEPRIYYRPYELSSDQEDRIDDQIQDAQELVDKELDDFDRERAQRIDAESDEPIDDVKPDASPSTLRGDEDATHDAESGREKDEQEQPRPSTSNGMAVEAEASLKSIAHNTSDSNADSTVDGIGTSTALQEEPGEKMTVDEDDDHAVDGDEDTVIY